MVRCCPYCALAASDAWSNGDRNVMFGATLTVNIAS
jgi:hypothetical protein